MTSNIGSPIIQEYFSAGKLGTKDHAEMERLVRTELRAHFRPEFLNRVDDIIIFHSLDEKQLAQIVEIQLQRLEKRLARQQPLNAFENAAVARQVAVGEVQVQRAEVHRRAHQGRQGLALGGKSELIAMVDIVKRLFPDAIARQHEAALRFVVKGEGEHSVETAEATQPPSFVSLENDLGVGVAGKGAARLFEFLSDLLKVVYFAVEDDPKLLFHV